MYRSTNLKKTHFLPKLQSLFFFCFLFKPQNVLQKVKRDLCTETNNNIIPHQQHSKTSGTQFLISEANYHKNKTSCLLLTYDTTLHKHIYI